MYTNVQYTSLMKKAEFYTADELAKTLKLNIRTIYRYIQSGKLKAFKIGKEYRIGKQEFNHFLDKRKTK